MTDVFDNMPRIQSFAETSAANGTVRFNGGLYLGLPEGVSTVSVSSKTGTMTIFLCHEQSASERFWSTACAPGETKVIPSIAVPKGAGRFLNIRTNGGDHDIGLTIITYPL
ncbi:hypothetical protein [uncultured Corynebacterium sp.]|uniref:hypothetical protein n=1 Tax=uncultured Corynebacterium sp. TaxID=159447 RepID=UPI00259B1ECB|nr:hypothetical protein [uncultured Corynebacterium sp.]